ncbi:uncharacterized protein LOC110913383 [Helianthus annuus]|uniref:uncharacterized protein LOC110913383 n=1 Tax=Helianthus annuus TaxID=4232 RepID=UPI000B907170|nr:uncharacterized protein LOC110913383 [Helianthus annuus]
MFDCKPHYINILPHFNGRSNDEPYTHLAEFSAICSTIGGHDFSLEEVKLRLFQFSLKDKAKQWFLTLLAGSIRTWSEMQQVFLDEYYSIAKTDDARDEIRSFRQLSSEPLHEKELIRKCPHHQIEKWELVKCFVRGLDDETRNHLESTSNGTLLSNHEDDDWEFLERMSKRSKAKESADRAKKHPTSRSWPDRDASSKDRIETLERELPHMKKREVNAEQYAVCEECGDIGHRTENCQATVEVNQVYGDRRQYDMNSNTYHPGLRNHPNFRYGNASNQMNPNFPSGNQGGYSHQTRQRGYNQDAHGSTNNQGCSGDLSAKMDAMLSMMQESKKENEIQDKSHEALAKQVGQLAEEMAQMRGSMGKLLSDTTVNPKHQSSSTGNVRNAHINVVSPFTNDEVCSSVESIPPPQCIDGAVGNARDESEIEEWYPPKDERWEDFKQAKINLPLLDDIKKHNKLPEPVDLISHVSTVLWGALPQKAQDPGDPLIPIQIGTFKIERALLDLGACVSILLGSLYDQYNFGPLKKFDTPVVLADQTPTHPRGMVEDVIVKVDDCYYPVDFLVVDYVGCVEDTQPIVILGRPFLATANVIINCATGTVSMKFGDRELNLNVFPNFTNPLGEDKCPKKDMNPNKKVCAMVGRFGETKKKTVKRKKAKKSPLEKKKEEEVRKFGPFGNKWYGMNRRWLISRSSLAASTPFEHHEVVCRSLRSFLGALRVTGTKTGQPGRVTDQPGVQNEEIGEFELERPSPTGSRPSRTGSRNTRRPILPVTSQKSRRQFFSF